MITASDGPEALDKLAHGKYDAVFTDIRMPGMDGLEVAARIKATQPWLPVVIITGYGSAASEAEAKEIGVAGFLHKPLSPEMIEDSARTALLKQAEAAIAPMPAADAAVSAGQAPAVKGAGGRAKDIARRRGSFIGLAYAVASVVGCPARPLRLGHEDRSKLT